MATRRGILVEDEEAAMMERHPEINWSAVFRQAVREKVEAIELAEQLREENDARARAVARRLRSGMGERWRQALGEGRKSSRRR